MFGWLKPECPSCCADVETRENGLFCQNCKTEICKECERDHFKHRIVFVDFAKKKGKSIIRDR